MKIATLRTLSTLTTDEAILSEINAEIERLSKAEARNAERKAEKSAVYEVAKPVVFAMFDLTSSPLTVAEIWGGIEDSAPEGFSKSKLSYALTHQWASEVVKIEGKVNAYRKA